MQITSRDTLLFYRHKYVDCDEEVLIVEVYDGKAFGKNGERLPHHLVYEIKIDPSVLDKLISGLKNAQLTEWESWQG